jgi:hypothetical protein
MVQHGHCHERIAAIDKIYLSVLFMEKNVGAWLEIRKDDGKIVKEKTFKSGIIVQTRSR